MLFVELEDNLPEPFYNLAVFVVAVFVFRHFLEGVEVENGRSTDKELELFGFESVEELAFADFVESIVEGFEEAFYLFVEHKINVEINVFYFVFLVDPDVSSVWL